MNKTCSDEELIKLIKLNTRSAEYQAYKCLKKSCSSKLRGTMRKFGVRDEETMNDLESDAFANLFLNVLTEKFKGQSGVCTYLISIAINKWRKQLRDRKIQGTIQISDSNPGLIQELEAYLDHSLEGPQREIIKRKIENDTDLQELLVYLKPKKLGLVGLESIDVPYEEVSEDRTEELQEYIKGKFSSDSSCVENLINYFFQHEANYYKMAHAIKRSKEAIETVYERVKKQVNRCLDKLKGQ